MYRYFLSGLLACAAAFTVRGEVPTDLQAVGNWEVKVSLQEPKLLETTVQVEPPKWTTVTAEKISSLPLFNPNAGGWGKGAQLRGVRAQETTTPYLLEKGSVVLRTGPESTD